ncbi:substrate-binding domain-containing protein [Ahrensia sp. R2A130]|uniref:substrate-binding domain-containing protein n=1 Tax=Ahrensia sp. R2A130 TaxID=744979 RepID=UPI0001E0ACEC|nr:substrate-binding domain-containing protein [Ahrensia sp. R2A130]EFL87743.1 phosphate ABC transporter periplasmic-binding protein [Ahrensia sp. R2A130]
MKKTIALKAALLVAAAAIVSTPAAARDQINVVGSSTVFPFATAVAERFGKGTSFGTPVVESTGSGGGLKLFCSGTGANTPDITNASRRIKASEVELCASNGVKEIVEVKVGYDGIVLANSRATAPLAVDIKDIYNALAKEVEVDGKIVANPYTMWNEVNPALPATKIEVLGPPPTSGTRDAFVELVMEEGCDMFPAIAALKDSDKDRHSTVCKSVREDGGYVEAGENDNLIIQKLEANADAYGIFGFSFLDQNADKVQGATIGGKEPTFENIADGAYPVSRSLFFYVKKAHVGVIPGIEEFLAEFTSEGAMGEDGYLADKGLIPMPEDEMAKIRDDVKNLNPLSM